MSLGDRFTISDSAPLAPADGPKKFKINLIPNVDLGHFLTICGFVAAMVVQWNAMDKKQVLLEAQINQLMAADLANRNQARENVKDIQSDVKEIKSSVEKLNNIVSITNYKVDQLQLQGQQSKGYR